MALRASCVLLLAVSASTSSSSARTDEPTVVLWGPGWSRVPPRRPLTALAIGGDSDAHERRAAPTPVWENFAEIPRAVELWTSPSSEGAPAAFFADTQGSLYMLQPRVAVHELIPRVPASTVDNAILSLAFDRSQQLLYYTVNTTLMSLTLSADGTKPTGTPKVLADFAPSGVQSLVVDWASPTATAYFCLFDGPNRTAGSLVRAPLDDPKSYAVLINSTLTVLSGRPFGDAMPRYALDLVNQRLYYVEFAIGISSIDLTDRSARPVRVPLRTGFRSGNPLVALSLVLLPPPPGDGGTSSLVLTTVAGNIGVVPVSGGDVNWVSSPCFPGGGCSYRQLWDMKLLPARSPTPSKIAYSLLVSWISVTDLDSSAATVQGASIQQLDIIRNASSGNLSSINQTNLYDTRWHRGHSGLLVQPHTCTAYYTQISHSSIFSSPIDPMQPPTANYTYRNFRFNPAFTIDDRPTPRAFWFEQYQNPHAAGDNGYALQLMSADLDDLNGRTSVLSSLCNTHAGALMADPATGDVLFQSTARSGFSVQHYCYRKASATKATLFYTQQQSYQAVNVAVDWKTRALYVSGTAFRTGESAIRRVSIDASDPSDNPEVVLGKNTSANAMAMAGDTLYFVQVSSYGRLKLQSSVLYSCKPGGGVSLLSLQRSNPCGVNHSTNLSAIPNSFSDQFSSIGLIAESDDSLLFWSQRGNSIARVLSRYDVQAKTWTPVYLTPMMNPVAVGGSADIVHYIDGTTSTFGSFAPIANPGPFNVPFKITGQFLPLSALGSGQPYPANGASGGWGRQFVAGEKTWYWFSGVQTPTVGAASAAIFSADMTQPQPAQLLTLPPNSTTNLLAIDEEKEAAFFVVRTAPRPGPSVRSLCGQLAQQAENLVMAPFGSGSGGADPKVVLEQPNGWCFGRGSPALDKKRGFLYYSLQDQYSQFMSNPHLAVLDLKTGVSTRMDWGFTINFRRVDFRILRLSDDGNTLWAWGCVRNSGEGCTSRMYVIDVGPNSPPQNNWTNATLPSLGPGVSSSGLTDFSVRGQPNATAFTFVAYGSATTSPPVLGVYSGEYVPRQQIRWRSELQPVHVRAVDLDASDTDAGLLVAARPPVEPFPPTEGILLLRSPLSGVGRGSGSAVLTPTVIPFPDELPQGLRSSNIVQLAHQKPHRLLFAFGSASCISDEIWEVDLSKSRLQQHLHSEPAEYLQGHRVTAPPEQLVSALLSSSRLLQSQSDGDGGTELSWMQCNSRVVFSDVSKAAAVDGPIDYTALDYAWLDIATDSRTSLNSMSRVDDRFILTYSNGSIFYGTRKGHHIEQITLLSNDSLWLPLSATVHDNVVYVGERNQSGLAAATAKARIRSIDLSPSSAAVVAAGGGGGSAATTQSLNGSTPKAFGHRLSAGGGGGRSFSPPQLQMFVADTLGVSDLSTMPQRCVAHIPPPAEGLSASASVSTLGGVRRSATVEE
eukprot:COSAG06_NODE_929_length_11465_cov_4.106722_5_plen_1452_part_00